MISEKIAVTDVFYKIKQFKEIISVLSILSALIGLVPILLYFYYHQFFPNMDLTNFTLLFFYSFTTTLINLGLIYFSFCIAGILFSLLALTNSFLNSRKDNLQFIFCYFILPFAIQLIFIFLFCKKFHDENIGKFLIFIFLIVPIIFGFNLSRKSNFSKKSMDFYNPMGQLLIILLFSNFIFSIMFCIFMELFPKSNLFCFILSVATTITPIILFQTNKLRHAVLGWVISVTVILGFSNKFPVMADNIIKNMHLGNYQAEEAYLTPHCCQKLQSTRLLAIPPYCSLQNVHVLWNLGDQYFLKLEMRGRPEYLVLDKKQDVLNFPKEAEKIIDQPS